MSLNSASSDCSACRIMRHTPRQALNPFFFCPRRKHTWRRRPQRRLHSHIDLSLAAPPRNMVLLWFCFGHSERSRRRSGRPQVSHALPHLWHAIGRPPCRAIVFVHHCLTCRHLKCHTALKKIWRVIPGSGRLHYTLFIKNS